MTTLAPTAFRHALEPGDPGLRPLLLLHGTGGDERDLLPLGRALAPAATLISPRGQVSEHGAPRFFRRLAEGVFDEPDLVARTDELADWLGALRRANDLPAPIAVGFSNGANIAAALLLQRPEALAGAVLLRAMAPFAKAPDPEGAPRPGPALILSGLMDPIAGEATAAKLAADLAAAGSQVERRALPAGHGLVQADLAAAQAWLAPRLSL